MWKCNWDIRIILYIYIFFTRPLTVDVITPQVKQQVLLIIFLTYLQGCDIDKYFSYSFLKKKKNTTAQ